MISQTFPIVSKEFSSKSNLNFRRTLLELSINLITATLSTYTEGFIYIFISPIMTGALMSPLEPIKLSLYEFLSGSLIISDTDEEGVASLRSSAILGLSLLVSNGLTSPEHVCTCYVMVFNILVKSCRSKSNKAIV